MTHRLERRRPTSWLLIGCALLLGACNRGASPEATDPSPASVRLFAGLNDPKDKNIAVNMFIPQRAKVVVGANVAWTFNGPEPHTVTFVPAGQQIPAPSAPGATEAKGSPGPFDGTTLVSSGILPQGTLTGGFNLTFTKAGTYNYVCILHPAMRGSIEVVTTPNAESRQDIRKRGMSERDRWLSEGRDAKKKYLETAAKTVRNSDGTTTHTIGMGTSTEHAAVLAFQPVKADIKPGDKVIFLNSDILPHSATFAGSTQLPQNPESPQARNAAPGPSPQTLNATGFFNTGWLPPNAPPGAGPPEAARSFTFVVPTAGTYGYVCILHGPSGQAGSIVAA